MKKNLVLFLLISSFGFAQNLNEYKYAMVPAKFSFLKDDNMYNLNLLTKMYMQKYGFETYYNNEVAPDDFIANNCNKIFVDILTNSNLFTTKVRVVLKDCKNNVLFTSDEGTSRDKEFRVAYNEALRMAFDNFAVLKTHKYKQNIDVLPNSQNNLNENAEKTTSEVINSSLSVVKTENGFDLYNNDNKLVLSAKNTSVKNVYIVIAGVEIGVLQKGKDDLWYFEYYREGNKKLISENLFFKL